MYDNDVPIIADHGLSSEKGLLDVIEFVLATIQQSLSVVPQIRHDIGQNGMQSRFLFKNKRDGLMYAEDNIAELLEDICEIIAKHGQHSETAATYAVLHFFQIPGLGVVKAAFVAQCLGFNTACIDSHNLDRLGISPESVRIRKKLKPRTVVRKIRDYVKLTQQIGCETLWNDWVAYVAETYTGQFENSLRDAMGVSNFHTRCICGDLSPAGETF